jgi:hypothetical protein
MEFEESPGIFYAAGCVQEYAAGRLAVNIAARRSFPLLIAVGA